MYSNMHEEEEEEMEDREDVEEVEEGDCERREEKLDVEVEEETGEQADSHCFITKGGAVSIESE